MKARILNNFTWGKAIKMEENCLCCNRFKMSRYLDGRKNVNKNLDHIIHIRDKFINKLWIKERHKNCSPNTQYEKLSVITKY